MNVNRPLRPKRSNQALSIIGIPRKFHEMGIDDFKTFDSPEYEEVKAFVKSYCTDLKHRMQNNVGIAFYGSNGTGKTMLASIIGVNAYMHRFRVRRITFVDYIELYTKAWKTKNQDEKEACLDELHQTAKSVELLILEEVGKEIDSKIAAPILEDLLRHREDYGFPIIMCMNITIDDIGQRYGASVKSLMKGLTTPVEITGADNRLKYLKQRRDC